MDCKAVSNQAVEKLAKKMGVVDFYHFSLNSLSRNRVWI